MILSFTYLKITGCGYYAMLTYFCRLKQLREDSTIKAQDLFRLHKNVYNENQNEGCFYLFWPIKKYKVRQHYTPNKTKTCLWVPGEGLTRLRRGPNTTHELTEPLHVVTDVNEQTDISKLWADRAVLVSYLTRVFFHEPHKTDADTVQFSFTDHPHPEVTAADPHDIIRPAAEPLVYGVVAERCLYLFGTVTTIRS